MAPPTWQLRHTNGKTGKTRWEVFGYDGSDLSKDNEVTILTPKWGTKTFTVVSSTGYLASQPVDGLARVKVGDVEGDYTLAPQPTDAYVVPMTRPSHDPTTTELFDYMLVRDDPDLLVRATEGDKDGGTTKGDAARLWTLNAATAARLVLSSGRDRDLNAETRIQLDWNCCLAILHDESNGNFTRQGSAARVHDDGDAASAYLSGRRKTYAAAISATWNKWETSEALVNTADAPSLVSTRLYATVTPTMPCQRRDALMPLFNLVRIACFASRSDVNAMALLCHKGDPTEGATLVRFERVGDKYNLEIFEPRHGFLRLRRGLTTVDAVYQAYSHLKLGCTIGDVNAIRVLLVAPIANAAGMKDVVGESSNLLRDIVESSNDKYSPLRYTDWWRDALSVEGNDGLVICPVCSAVSLDRTDPCIQCRFTTSAPPMGFPSAGAAWGAPIQRGDTERGAYCLKVAAVVARSDGDGNPECGHTECVFANKGHWACTKCWDDRKVLRMNDDSDWQCGTCKASPDAAN